MAKAKVKFFKCRIMMSHVMIEEFDKEGNPVVVEKKDMFKNPYKEVSQKTYKRGEIVILPEPVIKKLGKSVELVTAPVEAVPIEADPDEVIEEDGPEGDFKDPDKGDTVADKFPKPEDEGKGKGGKGK